MKNLLHRVFIHSLDKDQMHYYLPLEGGLSFCQLYSQTEVAKLAAAAAAARSGLRPT